MWITKIVKLLHCSIVKLSVRTSLCILFKIKIEVIFNFWPVVVSSLTDLFFKNMGGFPDSQNAEQSFHIVKIAVV